MGELIDPLENAWIVTQPSTTVPKGCGYVNTNTTTPPVKVNIFAVLDTNTYYGDCECGAQFHELEYTNFCPNCGAKWSK